MHSRHLQAAANRQLKRHLCPSRLTSSHAPGSQLQPGSRARPETRLHARAWSQEEQDTLKEALHDLMRRGQGDALSYKEVEAKFKELSPGTTRRYVGIRDQAKKHIAAFAAEQPDMAGVQAGARRVADQRAPPLTLAQMIAEVMSVRPGMQAGRDDVFETLGSHPIYAHLLNWEPCDNERFDHTWKATLQKTLSVKKPFAATHLDARNRRVYQLDTTASYGKFWKAAPYVLASLLATYLPSNKATAEELTAALIRHPLFREVLAADNAVAPEELTPDRFVSQVAGVLESNPELFAAAQMPNRKGYKGPAVYSAVLKPLPPHK